MSRTPKEEVCFSFGVGGKVCSRLKEGWSLRGWSGFVNRMESEISEHGGDVRGQTRRVLSHFIELLACVVNKLGFVV